MQSRKFESLKCSIKVRDILVSCHLLRSSNFNSNNDIIEINMVQHLINSFSKEQIKIRRKKNREKYPNNRLMNLILETLPSFSVPWDFYYFSPEERKQSDHRVTNHRDSRRKNEHSRRKGWKIEGRGCRCRCIAAGTGDKQKDRSVAGNIRVG